jgi:peroxiredoxin
MSEPGTGSGSPAAGIPAARPAFEHRPVRRGLIGPFGGRQIVGGAVVLVLVGVLIVVATTPLGTTGGDSRIAPGATPFIIDPSANGLSPGQRAPELTVAHADGSTFQLTDLDGHSVRLADLRGKAVWLNFWASWCPPCQSETPVLRDTYAAYRDRGLVLVGIAVQETTVDDVRRYAQTYGLGYTVGFDTSGDILHLYRVGGLPVQYFIDATGVIRSTILGPLDRAGAAREVEAILPSAAAGSSAPSVSASAYP